MGKRGPKPTPTAILNARGSWRGKLRPNEPEDAVEAPVMPSGMSEAAQAYWRSVVPELLKRRTLAKLNMGTLAVMCNWWGFYVAAKIRWEEHVLSGEPWEGFQMEHPHRLMCEASDRYVRLAASYGLTPSDLTRVEASPAVKEKKPEREQGPVMRIAN